MLTILECFKKLKGLPLVRTVEIKNQPDLSKISFPYYMKVSLAEHKLEKKAVIKIENIASAKSNYERLKKEFKNIPILIQPQVNGVEMILGLKQDAAFGTLLMIGIGGTNAEVLKDVVFRSTPVSKQEIRSAIESLKFYEILYKRNKCNIEKLIDLAYEVSKQKFKELDLNPVIVNEKEALIIDARGSI